MTKHIVNSADTLQRVIGELREDWGKHKFLRVSWQTGQARSLDFNAISHVWYEQLARELREEDALDWKCFCKLHFGVPIMRAEDEEFRELYDSAIKSTLSYERKLMAMKYWPVTSLMNNKQFKKYCTDMQAHFQDRVLLEFPPEPPL